MTMSYYFKIENETILSICMFLIFFPYLHQLFVISLFTVVEIFNNHMNARKIKNCLLDY
jgi:hypothetical protein